MPRPVLYVTLILVALTLVPLGLLVRDMAAGSSQGRLQVVPDMDNQPVLKAQGTSELFADGRAARLPVAGSVARGARPDAGPSATGRQDTSWVTSIPRPVTPELMARGQNRFEIFCAPCHGWNGSGAGIVGQRVAELGVSTWVPPNDLTSDLVAERAAGHLFNTITHGIRNMPAHGSQIPPADRWAIVAYVRALQRSVRGTFNDVPDDVRETLE